MRATIVRTRVLAIGVVACMAVGYADCRPVIMEPARPPPASTVVRRCIGLRATAERPPGYAAAWTATIRNAASGAAVATLRLVWWSHVDAGSWFADGACVDATGVTDGIAFDVRLTGETFDSATPAHADLVIVLARSRNQLELADGRRLGLARSAARFEWQLTGSLGALRVTPVVDADVEQPPRLADTPLVAEESLETYPYNESRNRGGPWPIRAP